MQKPYICKSQTRKRGRCPQRGSGLFCATKNNILFQNNENHVVLCRKVFEKIFSKRTLGVPFIIYDFQ